MSRFGDITPRFGGNESYLSVARNNARVSVGAVDEYFQSTDSVTPKYDAQADELAFVRYPGGKGLRVLERKDGAGGRRLSLKSALQSPQIGINSSELSTTVHLPFEFDVDEGMPYVSLQKLREALREETVEGDTRQSFGTGVSD